MEPLSWITVANLVSRVGMDVADFIIRKQAAGSTVQLAEWDELRIIAAKTSRTQAADAIRAAGLNQNDPHVLAVLAMLPK